MSFFPVPFYMILLDFNGYNSSTTKCTYYKLLNMIYPFLLQLHSETSHKLSFFSLPSHQERDKRVTHCLNCPLFSFHSISKPSFFLRFFFPMQFSSNNNQKTTRWDVVVETMSAKDLHGLSLIGDTGHPTPLVVAVRRTVAAQTW